MTKEISEKLVEFTEEGRRDVIRELFPELTEEEGIKKLSTFISYILLK